MSPRPRPRDRSADNILLAINTNIETSSDPPEIMPKLNSSIQRSVSFKRPEEINEIKLPNRTILKSKKEENDHMNNSSPKQSKSRSSSQEHIYDNLDVFKRSKPNEDESCVKTREHSIPPPATRLRPFTMHIPTNNDEQTTNEFENVFNQLKKRGSIRRVRPNEEPISEPSPPPPPFEETPALPPPPPPPPPLSCQPENEPIIAINKPIEPTPPTPQMPNRRKTVGGVYLPTNNKVATDDNKPAPSWIDIAKQKQSKL